MTSVRRIARVDEGGHGAHIGTHAAKRRHRSAKMPLPPDTSAAPPVTATIGRPAVARSRIANSARRLGSKADQVAYKTIINQMPPHSVYVEPFLGWGAVLWRKRPALLSIGIDKDRARISEAINLDFPATGKLPVPQLVTENELYRHALPGVAKPVRKLAKDAGPSTLFAVADAFDFLARYPWRGDELIYCDPPYPKETRTSGHGYLFELSPEPEHDQTTHAALLALLKTLPCKVMISSYHSALYAIALKDWRMITYTGMTRGGPREECLWMNYPEPVELHDYRFLGKNFRERQDIKRLKQRWIRRLAAMPALKRQAMLAAIQESNHA